MNPNKKIPIYDRYEKINHCVSKPRSLRVVRVHKNDEKLPHRTEVDFFLSSFGADFGGVFQQQNGFYSAINK